MEQAILAMLGITITLMLYLDRGRRADNAQNREEARADNAKLRTDMHNGFNEARAERAKFREEARADNAKLREDMHNGFNAARAERAKFREEARADNAKTREEARADNAKLREDMETGFSQVNRRLDKLTDVVMDLCRRVGRLEGRAEQSGSEAERLAEGGAGV